MIEAQQMKHRGMKIMDADWLFHCLETKIVRRAVDCSTSNSATRHPNRESVMIVISSQ